MNSDLTNINYLYSQCKLCPRNCGADRHPSESGHFAPGFCRCSNTVRAARAGLHYYEEPFLSGAKGSGTVFFSGCSLGCVYCQNNQLSQDNIGFDITIERLSEIFIEQQNRGAHNINLVTGTHFTPSIAEALKRVKDNSLKIPVIWNSSGYEKPETLKLLDGLVDIWLPDFKTLSPELGTKYMKAPDYPEYAKAAIECMFSMSKPAVFEPLTDTSVSKNSENTQVSNGQKDVYVSRDQEDIPVYEGEDVLMKSGIVVRHMVVPGQLEDSKNVLKYLYETYGNDIWISLMSQYTPVGKFAAKEAPDTSSPYLELYRTLTADEYDEVVDYAIDLGIENCMIQEGETASDSFIPSFDGYGIID